MSSEKWTARDSKADAVSGDQGLILDSQDSNNNKRMNVEDFSRLQSAINVYSASSTYKIGDIVFNVGVSETANYRCITAITIPENFEITKWLLINDINGFAPGDPARGVNVHSELPDGKNEKHLQEEISRLQSATKNYNIELPYKIGDYILFRKNVYRNIIPASGSEGTPENFDPLKWQDIAAGDRVVNVKDPLDLPFALSATLDTITDGGGGVALFTTVSNHGYTENQTVKLENTEAVIKIKILNGGTGYASAPTVVIGGPGTGAAATATVSGGVVVSILVTNIGSGYTTKPTIAFTGGSPTTVAVAEVTEFLVMKKVTLTTFEVEGLIFSLDPGQGDLTRCVATNGGGGHYLLYTQVISPLGYLFVDGESYFIESLASFNNNLVLVGTAQTLFTHRGTGGQLNLQSLIPFDGTASNTLFDIKYGAGLTDIVGTNDFIPINWGSHGKIDDAFVSLRNSGVLNYTTGLELTNVRGNVDRMVFVGGADGSTGITLDNIPENIGAMDIVSLNSELLPGRSVLDIKASNDLSNNVTVTDSTNNFGADFFKPGTEIKGDITAFSGTVGANPVNVTSTGIGTLLGSQKFIDITESTNFNGRFETTFVDANTISIVVFGGFVAGGVTTGKWKFVRTILSIADGTAQAGTITGTKSNGAGGTTILAADISTNLLKGASITIATSSITDTFTAYNIVDGVSFDINTTPPGSSEAGTWDENKIKLTILQHALVLGVGILVDKTPDNDGPTTVQTVLSSTEIEIAGIFVSASSDQGVVTDGSLTGSAKNVLVNTVSDEINSKAKGSILITGNTSAMEADAARTIFTAINTFIPLNFTNTAGTPITFSKETSDTELFKATNLTTAEIQYVGLKKFSGQYSASLNMKIFSGQKQEYNIRVLKNGGQMVDVAEFQITIRASDETDQITVTVSVTAETNDKFTMEIEKLTGSNTEVQIVSGSIVMQ